MTLKLSCGRLYSLFKVIWLGNTGIMPGAILLSTFLGAMCLNLKFGMKGIHVPVHIQKPLLDLEEIFQL